LPADRTGSNAIADLLASRRTRRSFTGLLAAAALLPWIDRPAANPFADPLMDPARWRGRFPAKKHPLFDEATASVVPPAGLQSRIVLKDSILELVRYGVIDRGKYFALRRGIGPMPEELSQVLSEPSDQPIRLTSQNASDYVDLLWPLGLANRMVANLRSPLIGKSLSNFASTAGWTLGEQQNGGAYFSKYPIVEMTPAAEALAVRVAKSTFRPCCGNSTFFQDCNHGSALLGVLELGASQGLNEEALYREALAFNSFWFPDYYIRTALYFKVVRKTDWRDADPKIIMGADFSAQRPWQRNVQVPLAAIPDLIPEPKGGANCGA
jgi:hypothetical protein